MIVLLDTSRQLRKSVVKVMNNEQNLTIFDDIDTCVDYVTDEKQHKILLIITENDAEIVIEILDHSKQSDSIFIICSDESKREQWTEKHPRVKGIFNNIRSVIEQIEEIQYSMDHTVGFDVVGTTSATLSEHPEYKNKQEVMFMYGQLIKEILIKMPYLEVDMNYMFEFVFDKCINKSNTIEKLMEFISDYRKHSPIWWYTKDFLFNMLNKALRTHDISLLYPMRVFIRDIHQELVKLRANSC